MSPLTVTKLWFSRKVQAQQLTCVLCHRS